MTIRISGDGSSLPLKKDGDKPSISSDEQAYLSMGTPEFTHDFLSLLRSRTSLIFVSTQEEARFMKYLGHVVASRSYEAYEWDCFKLMRKLNTPTAIEAANIDFRYAEPTLNYVIEQIEKRIEGVKTEKMKGKEDERPQGVIFVLNDFYRYLRGEQFNPRIERQLKYLHRLQGFGSVILTGGAYPPNPSLEKSIVVLDFPYPNESEIREVLNAQIENPSIASAFPGIKSRVKKKEEELVNSVKGLTLAEAKAAFHKTLVRARFLDEEPFSIQTILKDKKQIIRKTDILEYVDTNIRMEDVGGLSELIEWADNRKIAFSKEAKEYGLPTPKGALLIGVAGCGKSLSSKAIASGYGQPLLRLDFGRVFNSLVGESERQVRQALKLAETLAPCVAGDCRIYDSRGRAHKIEELINNDKFSNEPFYIYALNEKTLKLEKTLVNAIIRQPVQKPTIRLNTSGSYVEVTRDHRMLVNRNGQLVWIEADGVEVNDLLITQKFFARDTRPMRWFDALHPNCDINADMCLRFGALNRNSDLSKYETCDISLSTIGALERTSNIRMIDGFSEETLGYICGVADANGFIDRKNKMVTIYCPSVMMASLFCQEVASLFFYEPAVNDNKVIIENAIIADYMAYFMDHLFEQSDEALGHYLSGFVDAAGDVEVGDSRPRLTIRIQTDKEREKIKRVLQVFGVQAPKDSAKMVYLNTQDDLQQIFAYLESRRPSFANKMINATMREYEGSINRNAGYKIGPIIEKYRKLIEENDHPYSKTLLKSMTKPDAIITQHQLEYLIDEIEDSLSPSAINEMTVLMESDIIGTRVISIEQSEKQWVYDLACEKNHNFFANGLLCHNCVLWVDEIDKAMSGSVGSGSGDSGVTKRVIGTILTWLQEKEAAVFVVCTANNVGDIPPEFMRAGRFDEVFFIDLPTRTGREQIAKALLRRFKRNPDEFDLAAIAANTDGYSGAEIEKAIENALFECLTKGEKNISTESVVAACKKIIPLSMTRASEIDAMRQWAKGNCRLANTPEAPETPRDDGHKALELD